MTGLKSAHKNRIWLAAAGQRVKQIIINSLIKLFALLAAAVIWEKIAAGMRTEAVGAGALKRR